MENIVNPAASVFAVLLDLSLKSGLSFALVILGRSVCLALKQRRYVHLLWLILFFRLALPVDVTLPISPFRSSVEQTGVAAAPGTTADNSDTAVMTTLSDSSFDSFVPPTDVVRPAAPVDTFSPTQMFAVGGGCWLAGVLFFGFRLLGKWRNHRKKLRTAEPVTDQAVIDVLALSASACGLKRRVRLLQTSSGTAPYATGLLRPAIVVSRALVSRLSPTEWECVFTHEALHIKRHDLWLQALSAVFTVVYWFTPLVWIASALLRRDGEAACDTAALEVLGAGNTHRYGETVLRVAECLTTEPFPQCALGIIGKRKNLLRRLQLICSFRKKASRWPLAAAVILFCASLFFFTKAVGADDAIPARIERAALFRAPVTDAKVSLEFGLSVHPILKKPYFHNGMDMMMPAGTPVAAIAGGTVVEINQNAGDDYGRYVVLRHEDGFSSVYTKLKSVIVRKNQTVAEGEKIGLSGNTGVSTGPHLHFMLLKDDTPVNPREYILF